jgi:CRISPR system Cascade subunit CasD
MNTLLLRLAAPMQSWGINSKFDKRMTNDVPTKSGIIGLLACALGIRRNQSLEIFKNIKLGVRIDQKGEMGVDFQIVRDDTNKNKIKTWVTTRYYLMDAVFLVAIEAPLEILKEFDKALKNPMFPLYLGRRSCPPSGQVSLGIRDKGLQGALRQEPWLVAAWRQKHMLKNGDTKLEIVRDADINEDAYTVRDVPVTFDQEHRLYSFRNVTREFMPLESICGIQGRNTSHNPMELLEDNHVSDKN